MEYIVVLLSVLVILLFVVVNVLHSKIKALQITIDGSDGIRWRISDLYGNTERLSKRATSNEESIKRLYDKLGLVEYRTSESRIPEKWEVITKKEAEKRKKKGVGVRAEVSNYYPTIHQSIHSQNNNLGFWSEMMSNIGNALG